MRPLATGELLARRLVGQSWTGKTTRTQLVTQRSQVRSYGSSTFTVMTGQQISYTHWIYFPTEEAATASVSAFEALGGTVESRRAASGDEWRVTVRFVHSIDDLSAVRTSVRETAERTGGQYDGGEAGPL